MAESITQLVEELQRRQMKAQAVDYSRRGYHYEVSMDASQVRDFAEVLYRHAFYLGFVTAVHVKPAIEVVYQFACHSDIPCRINGKVSAGDEGRVPSISDIFQGANWHERETHDFFGIEFVGHPDLSPLIMAEEDADLKPLLKDDKKLKALPEVSWQEEDSQ